jgi:tetratricopeptide (TPR) repeat protein
MKTAYLWAALLAAWFGFTNGAYPQTPKAKATNKASAKTTAPKAATAGGATTDADKLLGRFIVAKSDQVLIKTGDETVAVGADLDYPVSVRQVNGDWLWILSTKGYGWIKRSDVFTPEEAVAAGTQRLKAKPGDFDALWRRSRGYEAIGQRDNEIADLTEMLKIKRNPLALTARASAHIAKGSVKDGMDDLTEALTLEPKYAVAYFNRGMGYLNLKEYDNAIEAFSMALENNNRHVGAMVHRGLAYEMRGTYGSALADYSKAIEIDPNGARAFNNRAWLLTTCPEESVRDAKMALADAKTAVRLTGGRNRDFADTLAAAFAANGDFKSAVDIQQRVIAATAKDDPLLELLNLRLKQYQEGKPYREDPTK